MIAYEYDLNHRAVDVKINNMMKKSTVSIKIPVSGVKCLYRQPKSHKVVCEIDVSRLRAVNSEATISEMFGEAELEYAAGFTRGFTDSKQLLAFLKG